MADCPSCVSFGGECNPEPEDYALPCKYYVSIYDEEEMEAEQNREDCHCDVGDSPEDFGPEKFKNGKRNHARDKALEQNARFVYEFDRD